MPTEAERMQSLFEERYNQLRLMMSSEIRPPTPVPSTQFNGTITAPYHRFNHSSKMDPLCWAIPLGEANNGIVQASAGALSESGYRRGESFAYVESGLEATASGNMTITITFQGVYAAEIVSTPLNYQNEANARLWGFIANCTQDKFKDDYKEYKNIPRPLADQYGALESLSSTNTPTTTLFVGPLSVNKGDTITVGAGVRQYSRSRYFGVAQGTAACRVAKIEWTIGGGN
ncbi:MAG: hypothetical protein N3B12_02215 [Armatimonadetes bacterium]|nr:hypothetical protein [Armatimonadota bacterium]